MGERMCDGRDLFDCGECTAPLWRQGVRGFWAEVQLCIMSASLQSGLYALHIFHNQSIQVATYRATNRCWLAAACRYRHAATRERAGAPSAARSLPAAAWRA